MSEYQYYEFLAVDRPLTPEQMAELRSISSRAQITPTRFQNSYSYGSFRGEPLDLVTDYFDAHVYVANWGSYTLLLGFPLAAINVLELKQYAVEAMSGYVSGLTIHERGERVIVSFSYAEEDGGGGWMEEYDAAGWLPSLIQLRADILSGDLRAMYLGWLAGATVNMLAFAEMDADDVDDEIAAELLDRLEPPVPAGLGELTAPLQTLARFLEIDDGLLSVAAETSATHTTNALTQTEILEWIAQAPAAEKDQLLQRVINEDRTVGIELRSRMRAERAASPQSAAESAPGRTVREILLAGRERATEVRQAHEAAEKRKRQDYLEALAGREEATWTQVQVLVQQKQARPYDEAVQLLAGLAELAAYKNSDPAFRERLAAFRERHRQKPSFIERLQRKGLG